MMLIFSEKALFTSLKSGIILRISENCKEGHRMTKQWDA